MIKSKKVFGIFLCLFALSVLCFASAAHAAAPVTLTGAVEADGSDLVMTVGEDAYILDGVSDDMIGKTIKATGTVEDGEGGQKILVVDSAEEAK